MKTLKSIGCLLLFAAAVVTASAQGVSIGEKDFTPNSAAILDVQSTSKGVLVPRVTYTQRMYIATNAQSVGLLVYQTDKEAGFYYWDGLAWKYLAPPQSVSLPNFATVATTGDYNDLLNRPNFTVGADGKVELAAVAVSGSFNDFINKPTFNLGGDGNVTLATVATTGSYNDLLDKPAIPTQLRQMEQDDLYAMYVSKAEKDAWSAKSSFSGSYTDLADKPTFATVGTTGSYTDLSNRPTIPTTLNELDGNTSARTVTDAEKALWNSKSDFSGRYTDLTDKPTFATVATTGSYNDLANRPAIPARLQDLQ